MFYTCVNRKGDYILCRGYEKDENGNYSAVQNRIKFSPTLFIPSTKELTPYVSIDGVDVEPVEFETMKDAKDFVGRYNDVDNFEVYGNQNYISQFIYESYPYEIDFEPSVINVSYIDIEVDSKNGFPHPERATEIITSICIKSNQHNEYFIFGCGEYDASDSNDIVYIRCEDEIDLLTKFINHWDTPRYTPDIISGYYSRLFDIPYLINRINKVLGEDYSKRLSPWRTINYRQIAVKGKNLDTYEIYGIQQLDYLDLFQKFAYTYGTLESYQLDYVAHVVLGENKLSYDEYSTLNELYEKNYQKFIDYNKKDVELVQRLEDKLGLVNLAMTMAYRAGVNYSDTFGTTMIWDTIIYRDLMKKRIVLQPNKIASKEAYDGGYVKAPHVGLHRWVCSFDLNSLYPSIIVQWNMSPETIVSNTKPLTVHECLYESFNFDKNYCYAANGVKFKRDKQGHIPAIIVKMYDERKKIKEKMLETEREIESLKNELFELKGEYNTEIEVKLQELERKKIQLHNNQMALKISLNSLYGALANKYFRHYSQPMAEAITLTGQLSIQWSERAINEKLNTLLGTNHDYVIAIDTDSVVGDTQINVNGTTLKIKDYYDSLNDSFLKKDDFNQDYVKHVETFDVTPSINKEGSVEEKLIKYVMKHKVKKEMFRITNSFGESVVVTEDHSIIVRNKRSGAITSIKPKNLSSEKHEIINLNLNKMFDDNFTVESLGVVEDDVYDLEVDDNHNFFGNGICVHNSNYVCFDKLVKKFKPKNEVTFLDKVCREAIEPHISAAYDSLFSKFNCYEKRLEMSREVIADIGIWTAKKRYVLNVYDNEGVRYREPKLKIVGIEAVKSSTPEVCRNSLKQMFKTIMTGSEEATQNEISKFSEVFRTLRPDEVSFPRGVSDIDKWYDKRTLFKKGCPIHVRGALVYNDLLRKLNLDKKYRKIQNGDKVKFCYLKVPNSAKSNVISFVDFLPTEFGLHKDIDYETQFEKAFISPILPVLDAVGWTAENLNTVDDFF